MTINWQEGSPDWQSPAEGPAEGPAYRAEPVGYWAIAPGFRAATGYKPGWINRCVVKWLLGWVWVEA